MDCLGIGDFGSRNDGGHIEIALGGRGRSDANRFVGKFDVFGFSVGFGIDHYRFDAEFATGALHAQGDLASVGNQDFFEHAQLPEFKR